MSEERKHDGKCLLEWLRQEELTEYGSVFLGESVREVIGLVMPKFGTKMEFDQVALRELSAVDYCRNVLLGEGKYLSQTQGDYRILLPSENARQIEQYIGNADNKLRRALKLSRNSPAIDGGVLDQTSARILMKREGLRRHRKED